MLNDSNFVLSEDACACNVRVMNPVHLFVDSLPKYKFIRKAGQLKNQSKLRELPLSFWY